MLEDADKSVGASVVSSALEELVSRVSINQKWYLRRLDKKQSKAKCKKVKVIACFETEAQFLSELEELEKLNCINGYSLSKSSEPFREDGRKRFSKWVFELRSKKIVNVWREPLWITAVSCIVGQKFGEYNEKFLGACVNFAEEQNSITFWTKGVTDEHSVYGIGRQLTELLNINCPFTYIDVNGNTEVKFTEHSFNNYKIHDVLANTDTPESAWTFWFYEKKSQMSSANFSRIATCNTGDEAIRILSSLKDPNDMFIGTGISVLRADVAPFHVTLHRGESNCWLIRTEKTTQLNDVWLRLVTSLVGGKLNEYRDCILGAETVINLGICVVLLWLPCRINMNIRYSIRDQMSEVLKPLGKYYMEFNDRNMAFSGRRMFQENKNDFKICSLALRFYDVPDSLCMMGHMENVWTFWFLDNNLRKDEHENLIEVRKCQQTNHFWRIFQHFQRVDGLQVGCAYIFVRDAFQPYSFISRREGVSFWTLKLRRGGKIAMNKYWRKALICLGGEMLREYMEDIVGTIVRAEEDNYVMNIWASCALSSDKSVLIGTKIKELIDIERGDDLECISTENEAFGKQGATTEEEFYDLLLNCYEIAKKQDKIIKLPHEMQHVSSLPIAWTLWYFDYNFWKSYNIHWKEIFTFQTEEEFLSLYRRIKEPSELAKSSHYAIYKEGIVPLWSGTGNGKLVVIQLKSFKTQIIDQLWLKMVYQGFRGQIDECIRFFSGLLTVTGKGWRGIALCISYSTIDDEYLLYNLQSILKEYEMYIFNVVIHKKITTFIDSLYE